MPSFLRAGYEFAAEILSVLAERRTWIWIGIGTLTAAAALAVVYPMLSWLLSVD